MVQKLRKLGIVPSEQADDATFLRRVSLDITGTLPSAAEVEAFLADKSSDKRAKKVDELLERPSYGAWWATKLCDITGNNDDQLNNVTPIRSAASKEWYDWIRARVDKNVGYDDLVEGIVVGTSRNEGENFKQYCENMSELYSGKSDGSYADRESMPHYWARRNFRQPEDRVIGFAYTFMGIRIQCAQCHKHPFDQWTKQDFEAFQGFFTRVNFGNAPDTRDEIQAMVKELGVKETRGNEFRRQLPALLEDGKTVPFQEVYAVAPRRGGNNNNRNRNRGGSPADSAKLLGGETVDLTKIEDARTPLMDWLRRKDNPYFARAFVNRVWASYFHRGIVEPPDDMSLANPPSNKALLDYLTAGFVEHDYDMKWLHREIANSRTYQLSWQPNETNKLDEVNFSRALPRRLPAEVAYDALQVATASDNEVAAMTGEELKDRAICIPGAGRRRATRGPAYALEIFGRSIRESNCDCDRSSEPSLLQTVFLQNDDEMLAMIDRRRSGWLDQVTTQLTGKTSEPERTVQRPDNFERMVDGLKARLKQAKADGNDQQVARLRERMKQMEERFGKVEPQAPAPVEVAKQPAEVLDELIKQAYLRTLNRYPSEQERDRSQQYIAEAGDPVSGMRGLLWALLNTKEFIVNH